MVMDVTPSPQCVGREFVRQYYTLLNKAPTHVHRFYNNNSSFVHGGLDSFNREGKPAVGQKQIHQCIQQLNFRDCHAKITQVDSQATLGNGVVVQVTGELSNGGQPMRRFTQTFVLGAQSPKQYYVHNDIFRYQDLVFGDDDVEPENQHYEADDEEPDQPSEISSVPKLEQPQYYASAPPMPTINGAAHVEEPPIHTQPQTLPQTSPAPTTPTYDIMSQQQLQQDGGQSGYQSEECEPEPEEELVTEEVVEDKVVEEYSALQQEQPPADNILSNEPKTYASTLVKSGGGVSNFNTSPNSSKSPPSPPPSMMRLESRNNDLNASGGRGSMRPPRGGPGAGSNMRGVGRGLDNRPPLNKPSPFDDNRDYVNRDDLGMDGDRRRSLNTQSQYADEQQLFLGNLPLSATENDLRELFKEYGNIVDLRIMSKPNTKSQNGNKVPNYGFIIFDSVQTVQAVLNARPIYFPSENGVKLNVEEKKTKPRTDSGGRGGARPTPMGGMRGSMSRGGQRGGFTRGGGGLRPSVGFNQRAGPR